MNEQIRKERKRKNKIIYNTRKLLAKGEKEEFNVSLILTRNEFEQIN